jgi:hypothetical protein
MTQLEFDLPYRRGEKVWVECSWGTFPGTVWRDQNDQGTIVYWNDGVGHCQKQLPDEWHRITHRRE